MNALYFLGFMFTLAMFIYVAMKLADYHAKKTGNSNHILYGLITVVIHAAIWIFLHDDLKLIP